MAQPPRAPLAGGVQQRAHDAFPLGLLRQIVRLVVVIMPLDVRDAVELQRPVARDGLDNEEKALERWRRTLEWRADIGADTILSKPHAWFWVTKHFFPHSAARKQPPVNHRKPSKL